MTNTWILVSMAALLLTACAGEPAATPQDSASGRDAATVTAIAPLGAEDSGVLDGTLWTVSRLHGAEFTAAATPSLAFEGGRVTGAAGCNRYFGQVSVTERAIRLSVLGLTRRACEPDVMATERAFLDALAAADGFALYGDDRLTLSAGPDIVIEADRTR